MQLMGMIGGTSWHSTIEYYRLLNDLASEKIGPEQNPPLLLYSLNVQIMRDGDQDAIKKEYLRIAQKLENAGAEAIIICANTPHLVYDFVQPKINIPILHIADATGNEAKSKAYKSLGLLGTRPTMTQTFLKNRLEEKFEVEVLIPQGEDLEETHNYISQELTQGKFTEQARNFYRQQIEKLKSRGADAIILGCTELPMLLKQEDSPLPLLDTTRLHAQMAVDFILE